MAKTSPDHRPHAYCRYHSSILILHHWARSGLIQQLCLPHNGRDPALCIASWKGAIDALT